MQVSISNKFSCFIFSKRGRFESGAGSRRMYPSVRKQYRAVIQGWHSGLPFWAGFLSITGIITEYFSQMTGNGMNLSLRPDSAAAILRIGHSTA